MGVESLLAEPVFAKRGLYVSYFPRVDFSGVCGVSCVLFVELICSCLLAWVTDRLLDKVVDLQGHAYGS